MTDARTHQGSCHCGKVAYTIEADLTGELLTCNCSICRRAGTMLAFVPVSQFKLERGEDALTDYQFGKKSIHHVFCSTCGVRPFAKGKMPDGTEMRAINVRCIEGIDLSTLKTRLWDGASI